MSAREYLERHVEKEQAAAANAWLSLPVDMTPQQLAIASNARTRVIRYNENFEAVES